MNTERSEQLTALAELEFACIELSLFLDTHPDDAGALTALAAQSARLRELKARYERDFGPLNSFGYSPRPAGGWVNDTPWPWECQ